MKPTPEQLAAQFTALVGPVSAAVAGVVDPGLPSVTSAKDGPASARPATPAAAVPASVAGVADPGLPSVSSAKDGPASARPATPAAASAAPPQSPIQTWTLVRKGFEFDATVAPDQVVAAAEIMDRDGFALDAITGVDWIAQNEMEVVYDYFHPENGCRAVVRTRVPRATPELPTISPVFAGANWHERETHDFFGIVFRGHPKLLPFLLPEDATFHPLRKDYQP